MVLFGGARWWGRKEWKEGFSSEWCMTLGRVLSCASWAAAAKEG